MEKLQPDCGGAKAVLDLQPSSSISVVYHPLFGPHDDLILLELEENLLSDVLNQRVSLRGQPDEDAVLCTKCKTYAIKFVGTSNSVFLIPPADHAAFYENSQDCGRKDCNKLVASVIKVAPGNMELVEVAPRLGKLKLLLLKNLYCPDEAIEVEGSRMMDKSKPTLYRWDDLVNMVQASDVEMRTALETLSAVEIDGYWRIVDDKYMDTMLRMLLHNSILNDWSLDALKEDEVVSVMELDGYSPKLTCHCLHLYGSKAYESVGGSCIWSLDQRRVCLHFAREILRGGKKKMESFMEEWKKKIPEGMQASFDMLEGEVLTEKVGVEMWVHPFSVHSLPSTPTERFSMLFKQRAKWEWKDLQPFIRSLLGRHASQILEKNTVNSRCRTCF